MINEKKEILSEECKEILINFFILKVPFSKKNFEKLVINKTKYENTDWDNNTSIVNYILSHKDYSPTNTSLNNLNKLTKDWSSVNKEGENSLFLLMKKEYKTKDIIKLIDHFNINFENKNNNNLYFINYFINQKYVNNIVQQTIKGINDFPEIRLSKYFEEYVNLILLFPELFKNTIQIEKNKFLEIKNIIIEADLKKFNQNKIGVSLESSILKVEKILSYLSLENQLKEKSIKEKKKKI